MNNKKGFTLIEVIVAVLVAGVAVVAVLGVILSTFTASPKSDQKETAALVLQQASDRLKAYATNETDGIDELPSQISTNLCPALDTNWAFTDGQHDASCLLTGTILEGGTLTYTVTSVAPSGDLLYRRVNFNLDLP